MDELVSIVELRRMKAEQGNILQDLRLQVTGAKSTSQRQEAELAMKTVTQHLSDIEAVLRARSEQAG